MKKDRRSLVFLILLLALIGIGAYLYLNPGLVQGALTGGTNSAEVSNPFGESLSIKLGSSSKTSGSASFMDELVSAAWTAYVDSDSQNVYEVNSTYKSQELVTLEYDLDVTYSNVGSITATVKIKAIDDADASYYEYTLANAKSISGASPINDGGQTQPSISTHLGSVVASATDATIYYQIYAQVQGTGSVSGETLTATIPYTKFGALHYERSSESSEADVTPTVSVASWLDESLGLPGETVLTTCALMATLSALIIWRRYR